MSTPSRLPVYGPDGQVIATVKSVSSQWMGQFLAECDNGHLFVTDPDAVARGEVEECPVCGSESVDDQPDEES